MKKITAIILATILVMSMLPTVFAEGEISSTEVIYKFNNLHFYDSENSKYFTKNQTLGWDPSTYGNFSMRSVVDYGNHGWKFFDIDNASEAVVGTNMRATEIQNAKSRIRPNYVEKNILKWALQEIKVGFNLKAPESGLWKITAINVNQESGTGNPMPKARVYLAPMMAEETNADRVLNYVRKDSLVTDTNTRSELQSVNGTITKGRTLELDTVIYSDGTTDLALVVDVFTDSTEEKMCSLNFNTLTLVPIEASEVVISATETSIMKNETATVDITVAGSEVLDSFVEYESSNKEVATIDECGNIIAVAEGKTIITATVGELSKSIEIEVKEDDEELKGAFDYTEEDFTTAPLSTATVNTFVAKLGENKNGEDATDVKSTTVNLGETCTVDAPVAEEGYKFLYWAKGLSTDKKQIVSYNESYSFIPTVENTYLIAVYEAVNGENEVNKAEFYNANGQLIETLTADGVAPKLPEMAGYNAAEGWALYGSDEVIAAGADVEVSGMKVYVAKFGNPKTVKVNGKDVAYGEKVSFTAEPAVGEIFKCWKKDNVIVSTDETYEFYAWKDSTTVEAVYVTEGFTFTGKAMKILLDSFSAGDKNALMAEFIGFEDAVEKGIMLGTKRFAMTTGASQFTLVNDIDATEVTGYAIFKDGTIVYDK